jgi:hypothetical protein
MIYLMHQTLSHKVSQYGYCLLRPMGAVQNNAIVQNIAPLHQFVWTIRR